MPRIGSRVAVTIPADLHQQVEHARRATGKSRGEVVRDALEHWLARQEEVLLVREYEAGYRKKPETRREVKAAEAAAVQLLATTEW